MSNAPTSAKADEWKWKVENAARTLQEARKIEGDKKLHAAALKEMKKERDAIDKALSCSVGRAAMTK